MSKEPFISGKPNNRMAIRRYNESKLERAVSKVLNSFRSSFEQSINIDDIFPKIVMKYHIAIC